MPNHTYGLSEIVGTSPLSIDDAIRNGIERASRTVRNLDWFEVVAIRGQLDNGMVAHHQVHMKLGFRIADPDDDS